MIIRTSNIFIVLELKKWKTDLRPLPVSIFRRHEIPFDSSWVRWQQQVIGSKFLGVLFYSSLNPSYWEDFLFVCCCVFSTLQQIVHCRYREKNNSLKMTLCLDKWTICGGLGRGEVCFFEPRCNMSLVMDCNRIQKPFQGGGKE